MPSAPEAFAARLEPYRASIKAAGSEDAVRGLALDLFRECFNVPLPEGPERGTLGVGANATAS